MFCAVLAWSREGGHHVGFLAECFEDLGVVPKVVLADRMGCLKGGDLGDAGRPAASARPGPPEPILTQIPSSATGLTKHGTWIRAHSMSVHSSTSRFSESPPTPSEFELWS